ncbi:hypothetical protein [Streptomyces buecherae]|uniref:hypothetical protein n=1 Tax=Streptomyces buecherae TaxID=2763006 RepID=UPI0036A4B26F
MGNAPAAFPTFAATSRRFSEGRWADELVAGFTHSASQAGDKSSILAFLATFAVQHRVLWVSLGLVAGWDSTTASENDLNRLGFWGGAGARPRSTVAPTPSTPPSTSVPVRPPPGRPGGGRTSRHNRHRLTRRPRSRSLPVASRAPRAVPPDRRHGRRTNGRLDGAREACATFMPPPQRAFV